MSETIDDQLALMSYPMRHMLAVFGRSIEHTPGTQPRSVAGIDAVEDGTARVAQGIAHHRESVQRSGALVVLQVVDAPRRIALSASFFS